MDKNIEVLKKYHKIKYFILCGGKCGGSTLRNSINVNINCAHFHGNNTLGLKNVYESLKDDFNKKLIDVYNMIDYNKDFHNMVYVIDCYRDPIERSISAFFQNISILVPNFNKISIENLINIFNKNFINMENYHPINNMMFNFGLKPFDSFDFNKKYNIKKIKNINFIKIRFKDINDWSVILTKALNREIIIQNENLTNSKGINKLYNEFKNKYKIPHKKLIEFMSYTDFNVYNNENEKKKYYDYWVKKSIIKN